VQRSSPLSVHAIHSHLATRSLGRRIELHERLDSTNREAVALGQAGVEHGTLVVADAQTAGRGRMARTWFSPPGMNLYASLVIRPTVDAQRLAAWLSWLPLMAAMGAAAILNPRATQASTYERWKLVFRANALTSTAYVLSVARPAPEQGVPLGGASIGFSTSPPSSA